MQDKKFVSMLAPISVTGGGTATTSTVDTTGFDYATVIIHTGAVGANGVATLKLQHSNTNGSFEDVTGGGFTALVDADDGKILVAFVDLRALKKWWNLVITNGATNPSVLSAMVILDRGAQAPNTAAERGVLEQIFVR